MRVLYAFFSSPLMLGLLSANTLSYTFTGNGSGTLNGTPFTSTCKKPVDGRQLFS